MSEQELYPPDDQARSRHYAAAPSLEAWMQRHQVSEADVRRWAAGPSLWHYVQGKLRGLFRRRR